MRASKISIIGQKYLLTDMDSYSGYGKRIGHDCWSFCGFQKGCRQAFYTPVHGVVSVLLRAKHVILRA